MQTSPLWTNVLWLWIQYDFYHEGLAQTLHNYNLCLQTVMEFIFLGSKITADGDCSREIKKHLFLGRKPMTNLDSILKNRDITLPKNSG